VSFHALGQNCDDTTTLIGGGITSSRGQVALTAGRLVAMNLNDSATSSGFSFGVSGVGGSNPGVSAGMSSSNRQGITYAVVSEGTIRITGTGADQTVLATLSRDANNRQIVTVNTSSNYSVSFSLNDFNNLTNQATSANSLIDALTAQIPGGIAAGGPDVESLYRDTLALGIPLSEFGPDPVATLTAQAAQERANAQADAYYDSLPDGPYPVPEHVTAAIQEGVGTIRSAVCQAWQMPVLPNKKLCTATLRLDAWLWGYINYVTCL
jgi:hypothetical protein